MGIEAIGASIGRAASVAPAIGRGAGFGPSLGRISGFPAPRMEGFSISKINNPFLGVLKAPAYIENRAPSLLGPRVESIKNPFKADIAPSVIARSIGDLSKRDKQSDQEIAALPSVARNDVLMQAHVRAPELMIVWPVEPMEVWVPQPFRKPEIKLQPVPIQVPKVDSKPQILIQPISQLEPQVVLKPEVESAFAFSQPNLLKQKVEEKKMQVQLEPENKEEMEEETENEEETRKRFLRDDKTLEERLKNLIAVISNVGEDEEFTGAILAKLMPHENPSLRSEVLKNYTQSASYQTIIDGSYEEMLETFGLLGKFKSKQEAYSKTKKVAEEMVPIRWGKDGTSVSRKDVDRVYKRHLVKANYMEQVENRSVKKSFQKAVH